MLDLELKLDSLMTLFPVSIRKDKKNYIVEEPISGDFFEMPKICIDAIARINEGHTLGAIQEELKDKYPNEDVDMIDFGGQLVELGLVQELDGEVIAKKKEPKAAKGGFTWLPPPLGRFFFNKVSNKIYLIFLLINIALMVVNPGLFPHYQDIFLFDSMMFNIVTYMGISLLLIIVHEFGHIFAIRSYGLPTKLGIGNRLIFVVFETDLTSAWKLEPKQRNILYFAGMSFEQTILLIALTLQLLFPEANAIFIGVLGIIVFDIFIKTIYQCCFYMKTDIYYFVENITGSYNLMESGKHYLSKWLPFLKKGSSKNQMFDGEQKFVRLYSIFYLVGILLMVSLIIFYFLPLLYHAYSQVFMNLGSQTPAAFWDAVAFLGQTVFLILLLLFVRIRAKKPS